MTAVSELPQVAAATTPNVASVATLSVSSSVTTSSVQLIGANPNRMGLFIYNNSANTGYINFGATANSSSAMVLPIATFATWTMPFPIYTGKISAIRNTGSGTMLVTELTA